jgi:hypothetical protein
MAAARSEHLDTSIRRIRLVGLWLVWRRIRMFVRLASSADACADTNT